MPEQGLSSKAPASSSVAFNSCQLNKCTELSLQRVRCVIPNNNKLFISLKSDFKSFTVIPPLLLLSPRLSADRHETKGLHPVAGAPLHDTGTAHDAMRLAQRKPSEKFKAEGDATVLLRLRSSELQQLCLGCQRLQSPVGPGGTYSAMME